MAKSLQGQARTGLRGSTLAVDPLQLVDTVIDGRYLIEAVVGAGGFGVVYRAKHLRFDSTIAVKVLLRDNTGAIPSTESLLNGTDEGRLQFRLAALHSAFARVFESGLVICESGTQLPYIAMEWLEGLTLKAHVDALSKRGESVSLPAAMALLDDLVQALSLAHVRRVAHRDLKPANVFLAWNDGKLTPKLLDFGLAKIGTESENAYDDTLQQASPFTPAYAAPEQWDRSMGATGPWTDVYSFALILTELLIGRRWFSDHAEPTFAALTLSPSRPTPGRLGAKLEPAVDQVFLRALCIAPRERFSTIQAFWETLASEAGWVRASRALCLGDYGIELPHRGVDTEERSMLCTGETLIVIDTEPPSAMSRPRSGTRPVRRAQVSLACTESGTEVPASIQPSFSVANVLNGAPDSTRRSWLSFSTLLIVAFITGGALLVATRTRRDLGQPSEMDLISPQVTASSRLPLPREPDQTLKKSPAQDAQLSEGNLAHRDSERSASRAMSQVASTNSVEKPTKTTPKFFRRGAPRVAASAQPVSVPPSPASLIMHDSLQTRK
jgi:serine/threonine-protein kinase